MNIIKTTADLAAVCAKLHDGRYVTVDTEFLRDKTYYPKLCLLQLAAPEIEAIVDPLAEGLDLAPFWDLLRDTSVTKVLHAARQDVEIFYTLAGVIPDPLYDTQIAAMVCGFGEQVGYETLVRRVAKESVDKGSRFTDWSRRPLSEAQLTYALGDVTHLRTIYEALSEQIEKAGRTSWVEEEMAPLRDPATYVVDPTQSWRRLKMRTNSARTLAIAQALAAWREQEAQRRDVPRPRVLKDETLVEVATQKPKDAAALGRLRTWPKGHAAKETVTAALEAVQAGLAMPTKDLPPLPEERVKPAGDSAIGDLLKVLLKQKAEEHGIAHRMIADAAALDQLLIDREADNPVLTGWRRKLFGEEALRLLRGEVSLRVKRGRVVAEPVDRG